MSDYYDMDGNPVPLMEWARNFNGPRHIGDTMIGDVRVSTVHLGLDHAFGMGGPPLIFETMVFGGVNDEYCARYSTKEQALAGHDQVVAAVKEGRKIEGDC